MSQQPKTETDRLANVLQVLQLGQKTGRLIVERNNGPQFEQGLITLVNGQVVQASLNQFQGPEAFNQLRNWGACRFAFAPDQRTGPQGRVPPPSIRPASAPLKPPGWGEQGQAQQTTSPLRTRPMGALPQSEQVRGSSMEARDSIYHRTTRNLGGDKQSTPTAWLATPYRTRHIEDGLHLIEQMGLSRTHRRLFLLIDGGRTVKELIRLMSHDPDDVLKLLQDLQRAGVVQV